MVQKVNSRAANSKAPNFIYLPEGYENKWVDGIPNEKYHALKQYVNSSSLRHILKSPFYFHWKFQQEQRETAQMRFGKLVHAAIYEPVEFKRSAVAMEKIDNRTKAGKEKSAKLKASLKPDQYLVDMSELRKIEQMRASIAKHPIARIILDQGVKERSGFFRDPETGLACRFRPDQWFEDRGWLIDFKTTKDISKVKFSRSIDDYDYDLQSAMYCEGGRLITGKSVVRRVWVVVENVPPFEVAVYVGDERAEECGWELYREAIHTLDKCMKSGEWPMAQLEAEDISVPFWRYERVMAKKMDEEESV